MKVRMRPKHTKFEIWIQTRKTVSFVLLDPDDLKNALIIDNYAAHSSIANLTNF